MTTLSNLDLDRADFYVGRAAGLGACFHNAIAQWRERRQDGWRVAVGIVKGIGDEHVHAWLERADMVMSVATGESWRRHEFYESLGVDPTTVKRINPRSFAKRGEITRDTVRDLLNAWGRPWRVTKDGGVMPA